MTAKKGILFLEIHAVFSAERRIHFFDEMR